MFGHEELKRIVLVSQVIKVGLLRIPPLFWRFIVIVLSGCRVGFFVDFALVFGFFLKEVHAVQTHLIFD